MRPRRTRPVNLDVKVNVPDPSPPQGGVWRLDSDRVNEWAWLVDVFGPDELDAIVEMGSRSALRPGVTGHGHRTDVRKSDIGWLYPSEVTGWVFARLAGAVQAANDQFFGFDLSGMEQGLQFTRYTAPGEHYDWHIDRGIGQGIRKLSFVVQLSDPTDYDGGELEIWTGGEPHVADRTRGVITFFPSWTMHRVRPVTRGVRYSLVCWVSGPSFR